jgi:hypothetical protein
LPLIPFNSHFRFVVYQDYKEFMNPGDDAKLLLCTSNDQTHLILYPFEDDKLVELLGSHQGKEGSKRSDVCILFPSESSLSAEEFFTQCKETSGVDWPAMLQQQIRTQSSEAVKESGTREEVQTVPSGETATAGDAAAAESAASTATAAAVPSVPTAVIPQLTIIVVDAVWRHARKMTRHLSTLLPDVTRVQLTPEQFSVYARKQSQPDRICTLEATALFLSHCGEQKELCEQLIDCVKINNAALKRKK